MDIKLIRKKVLSGEYDLSHHAHKERQVENISISEIEKSIINGVIIEQYPKDPRGSSCLVVIKNLHTVCGFRGEKLLVVTVYRPKLPTWIDWKTRAKELKNRE